MTSKQLLQRTTPYMFLFPALVVILLAMLFPVIYGLGLSFFEWALRDIRVAPEFRGLGNYLELFGSEYFYTNIRVTLVFTLTVTVAEIALGLILALLLEAKMAGLRTFRTIFVLPIMVAPVVVGVVWRYLYDPSFGMINYLLSVLGIEAGMWLSEPNLALPSIIIADIWQWTPFVFLLLLAGLQGVPKDMLEAGMIDGTNYLQNLWHIKLPVIQSLILVTAALRLIDAFRSMVVVYIMTFGGPGKSTELLSIAVYKTAFISQRLGLASALAVILLVIIFVVTLFVFFTSSGESRR
jgi:multiple sugar transport system permease protein